MDSNLITSKTLIVDIFYFNLYINRKRNFINDNRGIQRKEVGLSSSV